MKKNCVKPDWAAIAQEVSRQMGRPMTKSTVYQCFKYGSSRKIVRIVKQLIGGK